MNRTTPNNIIDKCLEMSDKGISVKEILLFHNEKTGKKTSYSSFTSTLAKWRKRRKANEERLWLLPEEERKKHPRVVGVIGDTQEPFAHPNYIKFCIDTFIKWGVTDIVQIGDLIDGCALSDYDQSSQALNVTDEAEQAKEKLKAWVKVFPEVKVCIGNHDVRFFKKLYKNGLRKLAKQIYRLQYGLPDTWELENKFIIDGVKYKHKPAGGQYGFYNTMLKSLMSVVTGHSHSVFGVKYFGNENDLLFGMGVACGIDLDAYVFDYTKDQDQKPILGCGIVISKSEAYTVPMIGKYLIK